MVKLGCTVNGGDLDASKFSNPIPWIGAYIAAASAICAAGMAVDAVRSLRRRKLWFPTHYFSLNATTLTIISVAIKLSVDLNTSMPRKQDQLSKLSSSALLSTVIANFLPSIGTMENKEILMNVMALGIIVITSIVNICIQFGTGVIFTFWKEHAVIMFLTLVLFVIMCSSALTVPATKCYFEAKYTKKNKLAIKECNADKTEKCIIKKLKGDLSKYWMMAHTCGPQFVIGRSATCTASGAFCLLAAMTLAEAVVRSYFMPGSFRFCNGETDYKWSTTLVLVVQIVAVVVGSVGPSFRFFAAVIFRCPKKTKKALKPRFNVESYWVQSLVECRECPFLFQFGGRHGKKLAHDLKTLLLNSCIQAQTWIVVVSKLVRLVSVLVMSRFLIFYRYFENLNWLFKCRNSIVNDKSGADLHQGSDLHHMSRFVLHLEGEEELVDLMIEDNRDATQHWFTKGKRKEPKNLLRILEKSPSIQNLKGVYEFDSVQVMSLHSEEPPNCWALPIVTLTSIAISLPGIDHHSIKQLLKSVNEGLLYVRVVQNNLNDKGEFENVKRAAEVLWLNVELYHRWLDVDLRKIALQNKSPEKVLKELAGIAKNKYMEYKERDIQLCLAENPSKWPIKVLAANSMYRLSQTILSDYEARDNEGGERLFERLSIMIADIMKACFTNLPRVIPMECHRSPIEGREESVRCTIVLLGKAEKILESLDLEALASLDPEELACVDGWRLLSKRKSSQELISSVSDKAAFSSSDVYLNIE